MIQNDTVSWGALSRWESLARGLVGDVVGEEPDAEPWLDAAEAVVREALAAPTALGAQQTPATASAPQRAGADGDGGGGPLAAVRFRCGRRRRQYLADIAQCQAALAAGEPSYEVAGAP